jgi:hypothetical protein
MLSRELAAIAAELTTLAFFRLRVQRRVYRVNHDEDDRRTLVK